MDDDGQLVGALPKLEVLAPVRVTPRPRLKVETNLDTVSPIQTGFAGSTIGSPLEFGEPVNEQTWDRNPTLWAAVMALPSWMVSFIFHLGLILVLATYTYVATHDGTIFLEISQTADQSEPSLMDITLEDPTPASLEDSFETFEAEDDSAPELPPVDLAQLASLPELYETTDPFILAGLPEFEPVVVTRPERFKEEGKKKKSETATEFFGTKSYGSDFVFVIDCSSSMSVEYRWRRAVRELVATLDQLDPKQKFLVLLYNDKNYMMFGAPNSQKLIPASDENKRLISSWLGQATPFSGTRPGKSVRLALKKNPDAIYFLSDGELRDNTMLDLRTWNAPKKAPDGLYRQIPIHTILLGSNFGRETMRTIADENNGIFTQVR